MSSTTEVTTTSDNNNDKKQETELTPFQATERADEQQITESDPSTQEILIYEVRGIKTPSGPGVKHLALKMAQEGQALQTVHHKMELVKHDPEDKAQWVWYAEAKVLNVSTGYQPMGVSEAWFLLRLKNNNIGDYDTFGRTKAMSKAQRNATSIHITKEMKESLYKLSTPENTKILYLSSGNDDDNNGGGSNNNTPRQPSEGQLKYLKGLKWIWPVPNTMSEAGDLISALRADGVDKVKQDKRWADLVKSNSLICDCENKQIDEEPQKTGENKDKYLCINCNRPIHVFISDALVANRKAARAAAEAGKK